MADSLLSQYTKGTRAWFQDAEAGWISAELTEIDVTADNVKLTFVDTHGRTQTFSCATGSLRESPGVGGFDATVLPPLRNPPLLEQTEDLTNLSYLNEPSVLHAIRTRYSTQQIYTYSGIVLVAVNPFAPQPIYDSAYVQMYAGRRKGDLEPHLFAIAEDAYRCMLREERDQTIICSGESGAGKTVSAKYIMRYFATVDDPERPSKRKALKEQAGMTQVETQILATNPIMEAFGNAKTTRNDNSSRFGKYIEILFDASQTIIGARIRTYLLERSRLVYQAETERNYHIFYQLLAGAPSSDRESLGLGDVSKFHYLRQGGAPAAKIDKVDDAADFAATQKALSTVGITSERQWQIFGVLAALLHLGNVAITAARNDAVLSDDDAALAQACRLLGISAAEFKRWTIKKQITTRSEKIVTGLSAPQALVVRDSVAKYIYSCLFDWLVAVTNESLASQGLDERVKRFIGVLDIYGFEFFKKNSFEQFCINYANEKLQQEFNAHVFKLEQEEYVSEKIEWTFIDFADNQPCINLIEGKLGVLSLLDEESRLPSGSDASFVQKLHSTLDKPENARIFKKPRFGNSAFTIAHYALDVTYDSEGFLEKNRDTVPDEHLALLQSTSNSFLKDVLARAQAIAAAKAEAPAAKADKPDAAANKRLSVAGAPASSGMNRKAGLSGGPSTQRKPTLGSIFKLSLISLMDTIDSTNAHYIRCIKPNEHKREWEFDAQMVLGQLRACGVLETIRISCAGYPTRWTYEEFAERYYMLIPSSAWGPEIQALCQMILAASIKEADKYQCGLTKIFFRAGMLASLEKLRMDRLNYLVTLIQKRMRGYVHRKRFLDLRRAVIGIQTSWRRQLAQRAAQRARQEAAAISIQRMARGFVQRTRYRQTRSAIVAIQSAARGHAARKLVRNQRQVIAATMLQSLFRGLLARRLHARDVHRIVVIQSAARRKAARRELEVRRVEAKSASHFKQVSYALEGKVIELSGNLQKRTAENKTLQNKLKALQDQLSSWISKHDELDTRAKELREKADRPAVAMPEFVALESEKNELDAKLEASLKRIEAQDSQIQRLTDDFARQAAEMEARQKILNGALPNGHAEDATVSGLRTELNGLREQLARAMAANNAAKQPRGDPTFNMATGNRGLDGATNDIGSFASSPTKPRRGRRHSASGLDIEGTPSNEHTETFRGIASVAVGSDFRAPGSTAYINEDEMFDDPSEEIMRMLEQEEPLDEDVLNGLIRNLKIPAAGAANPPTPKEVLFPAHLISLVTNEFWRYGYMRESERFLANVMQTIQTHVMSFQGEDAIAPGIFWLSNVHEILSFVCVAESDILQGIGPGADGAGREFDWDDYERLVGIVKHDLDSLEYNIYHTWMQEAKKKLHKMVIPALVESQSLPGFVTNDGGGRLFNRLISGNNGPAHTMDDILNLLNKTLKCLESYYCEHTVIQQTVTELLKLVGVTSFNDLLMRRNFCSWKRGIQIQYNATRLEEWCKSHDIHEGVHSIIEASLTVAGTLQLEHLMQATKLLQLKKATMHDIEVVFDVCWLLTPSQINKLVSSYSTADYENPISPEILRAVATRVQAGDKSDHLLLPPELEEAGPFEVPLPRTIQGLDIYAPAYIHLPFLRRMSTLVS